MQYIFSLLIPKEAFSIAIYRVEKTRDYTTMSNHHLRDRNLSNKARGLLSTILSLPDNWDYSARGLASICKDGVDGISAQLKELESCGYLSRRRIRAPNGRILDTEYTIYEKPQPPSPHTENPDMDTPYPGLSCPENPPQINNYQTNTEKRKKDESSIDSFPSIGLPEFPDVEPKRRNQNPQDVFLVRDQVKENIGYEYLLLEFPYDRDRLEELLELIVETLCVTKQTIRISGAEVPSTLVKDRLLSLDADHIRFVLSCLSENTTRIRNIKQYLLTTLYNAPVTIGSYYSALAKHDLSQT